MKKKNFLFLSVFLSLSFSFYPYLASAFPIASYDKAENLVDNPDTMLRSPLAMDSMNLQKATLPIQPWSDFWWSFQNGTLAYRYGDPQWPEGGNWRRNNSYFLDNPTSSLIQSGKIDQLSPAEKYELLIGNKNQTLVKRMWKRGERYTSWGRNVKEWMGLCDGWARASFNLPRPRKALKVKSYDGRHTFTLFPTDIKALATILWADGELTKDKRFIGHRCAFVNPGSSFLARMTGSSCQDTNPGTWHMSVVNQIGVNKRSFVMDARHDKEVWNQPVYKYEYKYFNPDTGEVSKYAADVTIPASSRSGSRSRKMEYLVGVEMVLTYIEEHEPPVQRISDAEEFDVLTNVTYRYDLELDEDHEIVGGSWHQTAHPDFLWVTEPGIRAVTEEEDDADGEWNPLKGSIPASWAKAADDAIDDGLPLGKIVETLFKYAK